MISTGEAVNRQPDSDAGRVFIGYARVSTRGQDLSSSGPPWRGRLRPHLRGKGFRGEARPARAGADARPLARRRRGDDHPARPPRAIDGRPSGDRGAIKEAGAGLRSLAEPWADTTTPAGRMVLTVFAGIADFERSLIVDRTSAGRIAAKARGVRFGPSLPCRPSRSPTPASSSMRTRSRWRKSPGFWGASRHALPGYRTQ